MQAAPPPLRDIHAAPPPPWWPPAWGWWALAAAALLALCWGGWLLWRRWRRGRRIKALGQELEDMLARWQDDGDNRRAASSVSLYLRRLVLHEAGEQQIAALTGESWVNYLTAPPELEPHLARVAADLAKAPYQAQPEINVESLFQLCRFWLRRVVHV